MREQLFRLGVNVAVRHGIDGRECEFRSFGESVECRLGDRYVSEDAYAVRCSALGWFVVAIVAVAGSLVGGCFQFVVFAL